MKKGLLFGCGGLILLFVILGIIGSQLKPPVATQTATTETPPETTSSLNEPSAPTPPSMGKWIAGTTESEFDNSKGATAALEADNTIEGWPGQTQRPTLILRCQENKTELILRTELNAAVEPGNLQAATLRIRLDDKPAFQTNSGQSTDSKAYFIRNPVAVAKQVEGAQRMLIGFTPFNSNPATIEFTTDGAKEAFKQVRAACKW